MEEEKKRNQPSNYVTLLQLQERWTREQQRTPEEKVERQAEENDDDVLISASDHGEKNKQKNKKKKKKKKKKGYSRKTEKQAKEEKSEKKTEVKEGRSRRERGNIPARKSEERVIWQKAGDDAAKESDRTVEIECVNEIGEKLENVRVEEDGEKRGYVRRSNRTYGNSGCYNAVSDRGEYRRRNGYYDRGVGRNWYGRNGRGYGTATPKVWVKKEHNAVEVNDGELS